MWTAGVDEAGYGPFLGPLVVSLVAICAEGSPADRRVLFGDAIRRPGEPGDGMLVGDSKAVYRSGGGLAGLAPLETSVLAFLGAAGAEPRDLDAYLSFVAPSAVGPLDRYPWYRDHDLALPVAAHPDAIRAASRNLAERLSDHGLRMAFRQAPILEGEFNRLCARTPNKANVLFDVFSGLLLTYREWLGSEGGSIVVDRHGGRAFYALLLQQACPDAFVAIERESGGRSDYRIFRGKAELRVSFLEKADQSEFEVALASMLSKYTRELFMALFNRYWRARKPDLKPTAGYAEDARRFLGDIACDLDQLGIERALLVRSR